MTLPSDECISTTDCMTRYNLIIDGNNCVCADNYEWMTAEAIEIADQ